VGGAAWQEFCSFVVFEVEFVGKSVHRFSERMLRAVVR
jgi:hypothetical protein